MAIDVGLGTHPGAPWLKEVSEHLSEAIYDLYTYYTCDVCYSYYSDVCMMIMIVIF